MKRFLSIISFFFLFFSLSLIFPLKARAQANECTGETTGGWGTCIPPWSCTGDYYEFDGDGGCGFTQDCCVYNGPPPYPDEWTCVGDNLDRGTCRLVTSCTTGVGVLGGGANCGTFWQCCIPLAEPTITPTPVPTTPPGVYCCSNPLECPDIPGYVPSCVAHHPSCPVRQCSYSPEPTSTPATTPGPEPDCCTVPDDCPHRPGYVPLCVAHHIDCPVRQCSYEPEPTPSVDCCTVPDDCPYRPGYVPLCVAHHIDCPVRQCSYSPEPTPRDDCCTVPDDCPHRPGYVPLCVAHHIDCPVRQCSYEPEPTSTPTPTLRPRIDPRCGQGINTAVGCIPIESTNDLAEFFLGWGIGIGGGIAFLLILYAGFQITTSAGDPQKIQAGKELLTAAIAGVMLLIFSVFLLELIGVRILRLPGF